MTDPKRPDGIMEPGVKNQLVLSSAKRSYIIEHCLFFNKVWLTPYPNYTGAMEELYWRYGVDGCLKDGTWIKGMSLTHRAIFFISYDQDPEKRKAK